jgi:hypothetical protein
MEGKEKKKRKKGEKKTHRQKTPHQQNTTIATHDSVTGPQIIAELLH